MKNKKQIKEWQIASIHWLIAGVLMPLLFSAIFGYIVKGIAENFGVIVWLAILGEAIKFFIIWVSIIYSAKYINKKFIIKNNLKVAMWATVYLCVFVGFFRLVSFNSTNLIDYIFSSMHLISLLVIAPFFYFLSKNYIKNSNESREDVT